MIRLITINQQHMTENYYLNKFRLPSILFHLKNVQAKTELSDDKTDLQMFYNNTIQLQL